MKVWKTIKDVASIAQLARDRVKTNMQKMQNKAKLAMTVLKAARLHRKRTKTTDDDVREKYPLRVMAPDPRQVKIKKGAFLEDISVKALIHSSEESYLPRWEPGNASDEEGDEELAKDHALANNNQGKGGGVDPLNFQFRTPIVEADANVVDMNTREEALAKWGEFFDAQDSSKIVGKDALMSDDTRAAHAEADALEKDYMHLIEARRKRAVRERDRKLAAAAAERRHAERQRLAELLRVQRENEGSLAMGAYQEAMRDGIGLDFNLRVERAERLRALKSGRLTAEPLPIDKVLIRQILSLNCLLYTSPSPRDRG